MSTKISSLEGSLRLFLLPGVRCRRTTCAFPPRPRFPSTISPHKHCPLLSPHPNLRHRTTEDPPMLQCNIAKPPMSLPLRSQYLLEAPEDQSLHKRGDNSKRDTRGNRQSGCAPMHRSGCWIPQLPFSTVAMMLVALRCSHDRVSHVHGHEKEMLTDVGNPASVHTSLPS